MAQERFDIPIKEMNDYDEEFENDGLDDYSDDDYYDDERYEYTGTVQQERSGRRGNSFSYSGSGHSNEMNEDSRKDHHNQLERKRRASIKSSYTELREAIPSLRDNKASRSVILQKAVDYLEELSRRNIDHVACVDHFSSENSALEAKCRDAENQVQTLLRQQRQSHGPTAAIGNTVTTHSHTHNNTTATNNTNSSSTHTDQSDISSTLCVSRSSLRARDEEDSNDVTGSRDSTPPPASTSRSSMGTHRSEANAGGSGSVRSIAPGESSLLSSASVTDNNGSNSSSVDCYDDQEEVGVVVVVAKKPRIV